MEASPTKRKRAMPAPPLTSSPDALRTSDPDSSPPLPPPGRPVRIVARVVLWALIGIAALHGVLPTPAAPEGSGPSNAPVRSSPDPQSSGSPDSTEGQIGMATAATFLREYLTVDGRRAERPGRVERYLARGVDLDDGVVPDRGISQSTDLVLPAGVQATKGGMEVTVLAHLLRIHDGPAQDGGTVAFVVPLVGGPKGIAVGGIPRPVALPIDPGLTAPAVRPFPDGWRPVGITSIRPAGPPETPTAQVLVRARPAVPGVEYLLPVRVFFRPGAGTPTVREVDAGGAP